MKLAWAYHCNAPTSGLNELRAEHNRVTDLWDVLVGIEHRWYRHCEGEACRFDPAIASARDRIVDLSAAIRAAQKADRKLLSQARYEARVELWGGMKRWRKECQDEATQIERERQAAVKLARQQTPAWWCNYNETIQRYQAGRIGAMKAGRRLRYHDNERDDGVLCVQIQRTQSGLGAAPDELALSMIHLDAPEESAFAKGTPKSARWAMLTMRVDATGNTVTLPMYMHRPFPRGCRIKGALLTWRREGTQTRWQVVFRLAGVQPTEPRVKYRREGSLAFCWEMNSGDLIVARPSWREPYALPADMLAAFQRISDNQAWMDRSLDEARAMADDRITSARLSGGALSIYALRREDLPDPLHGWLAEWRHTWWRNDHGRRKVIRRRRDVYRQWAREIVRECPSLDIDDQRLDRVARKERGSDDNSLRQRACIHFLRAEIVHQARKIGAEVRASGKVLTADNDEESGAWQRKKSAKMERSREGRNPDGDQPSA